jgi:large subunit ribosomal protein L13Ae
LLEFNP